MNGDKISERFRDALRAKKIKQSEIVAKTGIPKSSISSYLSGKYTPKQTNIYKISKALDVNPNWLMGYDVPMETSDSILENFLEKINYGNIEEYVKSNPIKTFISVLDINDIIQILYSTKAYDLRKGYCKNYELLLSSRQILEYIDSNFDVEVKVKDLQSNEEEFEAKKSKLLICIKEHFSRKDILKEIAENFEVTDKKTGKIIIDKETKIDKIDNYFIQLEINNLLENFSNDNK